MNIQEISAHENICVMGLGKVYSECIGELEENLCISYICDNNPLYADSGTASKYRFLLPTELPQIPDVFVIVTTSLENYLVLDNQLTGLGIPNCYVLSIQDITVSRPVVQLSKLTQTYEDKWGNVIEIPKSVVVSRQSFVMFGDDANKPLHYGRGRNNRLRIGEICHAGQFIRP